MTPFPLAISTWDKEEVDAVNNVLISGHLTMGHYVEKFESEFAEYSGSKFAVMFNSGSSANLALLFALKYAKSIALQEGSEFIVPAVSWSTTFYPVHQAGFKLKFVDIDMNSLNIDVDQVERAITRQTAAIFAVNLLGNPAELEKLKKIAHDNSLVLIEDNCESLGAELNGRKAGTYGLAGSYSFYFSHHICTIEGGMVTTDSEELFQNLKSIRAHGWTRGLPKKNYVHELTGNDWEDLYRFVLPGFNLRPLELEGAVGSVQLKKFPDFLKMRRKNASKFVDLFGEAENLTIQRENGASSWFGFSLVLNNSLEGKRTTIINHLNKRGYESRPIVAGNFVRNPVIKHLNYETFGDLPNSNHIHENGLFFGNHHIEASNEIEEMREIFSSESFELP